MNKNENLVFVLKEPQFKKTHPETDPKEWGKKPDINRTDST